MEQFVPVEVLHGPAAGAVPGHGCGQDRLNLAADRGHGALADAVTFRQRTTIHGQATPEKADDFATEILVNRLRRAARLTHMRSSLVLNDTG